MRRRIIGVHTGPMVMLKPRTQRGGLPEGKNCNSRPVWEPPILDYSDVVGEVFEKKKEAVLRFTNGDVVRNDRIY